MQKVQDAQASAISAVDQAGKTAGTQAVSEVYSAKDTAIADIATVKSGAESAITAAQQSAVQTVQQSGTTAVGQVQKAQNTATTAIAQAQQNAITSVENEGDAQVQRLQEIVPQPTADNNGMVVAVQSGAYQLENPAGLVLNDGVITSKNGWSSMQIVKTLCPQFTVSGATVQCTPVANYPLGVQVAITPTQEGTGDPSPENVRPIVGLDSVQVTRCGKNLWNYTLNSSGKTWIIPFIPKGTYTFSALSNADWWTGNPNANKWYLRNEDNSLEVSDLRFNNTIINQRCYATVEIPYSGAFTLNTYSGQTVASVQDMQVEVGSIATAYAPYTGTTHTLTLPETIYGGTVDAVTGDGVETVHGIVLDGTELWLEDSSEITGLKYFYYVVFDVQWLPSSGGSPALAKSSQKISHFAIGNPHSENVDNAGWVYSTGSADHYGIRIRMSACADVDEWKSYLAAQAAAGTPVTIAYKIATPAPFSATGNAPLPALPGTNTVYTDADTVTVSGLSDPVATIASLQARVSALESAQTNM